MNEVEIKELVEDFLAREFSAGQSPHFSETWKADIVSRLQNLKLNEQVKRGSDDAEYEKNLRKILLTKCETIHKQKLQQLRTRCEAILKKNSQLDYERVNYIVFEAYLKWYNTFDPEKIKGSNNPELYWFNLQVEQATSKYFGGKDPKIESLDAEEGFQSYEDPKAQQLLENIIREREGFDLDEEYQTVTFKVINTYGVNRRKSRKKKRVAFAASQEIFRCYLLTKRVDPPSDSEELSPLIGSYKHNLKSFIDFHQARELNLDLSLLNTGSVTGYFKMRHHVMCNADARRWMELAIAQLRESKEKKQRDLSNAELDSETKQSIEKAPVLSSVAVCTNERVFTCFKGEVNETIQKGGKNRDITWDKHCEYSLFVDKVRDENMHLLKGGTLYVTLEPCNKRGATGEGSERRAKTPCAVRCVEAGFTHYYIGSFDYNKSIRGNGIEVLKFGIYEFKLENGDYAGEDATTGSALLEQYFQEKGYPLIEETQEYRKYEIGKPASVSFFDADLMLGIYNLNAEFQHHKIRDNDGELPVDTYGLDIN